MVYLKGVEETPLTPMRASRTPHQNRKKRDALLNDYLNGYTTTRKSPFLRGKLVLAINAHKQGQFLSFRSAVTTYDIPGWPRGPQRA